MKKLVSLALAAVVAAGCLSLTACGPAVTGSGGESSQAGSSSKAEASTPAISGQLTLTGSTSMNEVCNALAESFMKKHRGVTVVKGGTGSGEGPVSVSGGTAQIGDLSRNLKESENPAGFDRHQIAIDGIAVVVNKNNPVTDLTQQQISDIFTGKITSWKELGGSDKKINVIGRDAQSGTRDGFESIFDCKEKCVYAAELDSTGKVSGEVEKNESAIGYISLGSVDSAKITVLKVDGVEATDENIVNGTYPVNRPFIEISKKGASESDPLIKAWFDFIFSDEGKAVIEDCKLIPVERN